MGTSPMPALQPCALMCLYHMESLRTPAWRLMAVEMGRSRVACREVGTAITPVGTHCAATCVTPVSRAEKEVNTSGSEGVRSKVTDSAVLTDSLLWHFSREQLQSVPRGDLERSLETALLVNEVLSGQLNELSKSKGLGLGLRVGPADQRETCTQTDSTQAPEVEELYRSLYLQHAGTVRELQLCVDQYRSLGPLIGDSRQQQNSLVEEGEESLAGAAGAYEGMKKERARMHEQYREMRELLKGHMETLSAMRERTQRALQQSAESQALAETALREKEAVDQCCRDLSASYAHRLGQLELDLVTWQQMCESLQSASVEQHGLCGEFEMLVETMGTTYQLMADKQQGLRVQLQAARELSCQSRSQLQAMSQATASALGEQAALRTQVDEATWKTANMQQELEQSTYALREALDKGKRLTCDNLQLKSGLESLSEQLAGVEEERDKLMKDNSGYFVALATAEAALKLSAAALAERTERLQTCEAESKELVDTLREKLQSLEEAMDQLVQEKESVELSRVESRAQVARLTRALKLKDEELQKLSDIRAQAALVTDNNEFMEQELKLSREQLTETEGQLSEQVRLLHTRNLQCEELRARCGHFQMNLATVKNDAREMLLEMGEQMSQAMVEVSSLKGQMQDATKSAEAAVRDRHQNHPRAGAIGTDQPDPASSTRAAEETAQPSKELQEGAVCGIEPTTTIPGESGAEASLTIGSCGGAFTRVEPVTPRKAIEDTLLLRVGQLREAMQRFLDGRSLTDRTMQQQVQDLQQEISRAREQRKATYSKNWLELQSLQHQVGKLETENRRLNRDLQAHSESNAELEKAISLKEQMILEFNKQMETNFKEHTEFLAMQERVTDLKRQLQRAEIEALTFREELIKLQGSGGALDMGWLQEKVDLQQQVKKLREANLQKESNMQELTVKMARHRAILEQNNQKAETELAKLDNLIEHVRIVLLSVPGVIASSVELKGLLHYLGDDVGE
uniref:sperm-associated antigen 5 isoform X2 n=1 Tax=Pristiophorus japonicus TaxID=55135 RepID=UPI00398E57A9